MYDRFFQGYEKDAEPRQAERDGVMCRIQYFKGEHKNEYLAQTGKEVRHYRHGLLEGSWMVSDDDIIGEFERFHDGCAQYRQEWKQLMEKNWVRTVNGRESCIREIVEASTEQVIYRGGIDETGARDGRGIEFNHKLTEPKIEGYWEGDKLKRILRLFKGEIMTEFCNTEDNSEVSSRIPIYYGGYQYDEVHNSFIRHGKGSLINIKGIADREGEWEKGIPSTFFELTDGWYKVDDNPLKNQSDSKIIVVKSHAFKEASSFNLSHYKKAETIEIGGHNFQNVDHFEISGMDALQTLSIGDYSFYKDDRENRFFRTCSIMDCKNLRSIKIGNHSFHYFSNRFELVQLPSLEHLEIGVLDEDSACFSYCNLEIRGLFFCVLFIQTYPN